MSPFEYLQTHVVSVIKPSRISGVGLFAVRDIEKDEPIFKSWVGESGVYSITHAELFELSDELQKNIYETFDNKIYYTTPTDEIIQIPKTLGKIFFPLEKNRYWIHIWPTMYINSGLSNANVDTKSENPYAIRNIRKGEELLGNYGSEFRTIPKNFI